MSQSITCPSCGGEIALDSEVRIAKTEADDLRDQIATLTAQNKELAERVESLSKAGSGRNRKGGSRGFGESDGNGEGNGEGNGDENGEGNGDGNGES